MTANARHSKLATAAPIVKWAGGKTRLLTELIVRMPSRYSRYYEPFVGGGGLFFRVAPERAVIGDANEDLIAAYRTVSRHADSVIDLLEFHGKRHSKSYYAMMRARWNSRDSRDLTCRLSRAAVFIYLNRTCFNGLWRVNSVGEFNVPIGAYTDPLSGISERLRRAAPILARADIRHGDYVATVADARAGDFVYLDPPYDGTFGSYTAEKFGAAAQAELAFAVRTLANRGVQVMTSNADTPNIRALYAGLRIDRVKCGRAINSNGKRRGAVNEVIVTAGYDPPEERAA